MRTRSLIAALALGSLALASCTTTKTATTTTAETNPSKRVYTQQQLQETGDTQTGPALQKLDPAVRVPRDR
jgi:predicted small secreted protein